MWISRKKWARRETKSIWSIFFHDLYQLIQLSRRRFEVSVFGAEALHKKTRPRAGQMQMVFCSILFWFAPWCPCINSSIYDSVKNVWDIGQKHVYRPWFQLSILTFKKYQEKWYSISWLDAKWWFQTWIHFSPHLGKWSNSTAAISFKWAETTNWILLNDLF